MKIGELAQIAQTTVETVRYYEKQGLLPETTRTAGNFRVYGVTHQERLRFIRNCRALDMSHEEIRDIFIIVFKPTGKLRHHSFGIRSIVAEDVIPFECFDESFSHTGALGAAGNHRYSAQH